MSTKEVPIEQDVMVAVGHCVGVQVKRGTTKESKNVEKDVRGQGCENPEDIEDVSCRLLEVQVLRTKN